MTTETPGGGEPPALEQQNDSQRDPPTRRVRQKRIRWQRLTGRPAAELHHRTNESGKEPALTERFYRGQ
jgi:hypothetical protein